MEIKKIVRITDEQRKMLEILKKDLGTSENAIFRLALLKLYKELKNE